MNRIGMYAGSFDPPTNGHVWMICEGSKLFDKLIIVIGTNPIKQNTFTLDERFKMLEEITLEYKNVSVIHLTNTYLVHLARSLGVTHLLRGIRSIKDYTYECGMRYINSDINLNVTTVFLIPPKELSDISSSIVKSLVGPVGWEKVVGKFVPAIILSKLQQTL